jgi:hypothetical protein
MSFMRYPSSRRLVATASAGLHAQRATDGALDAPQSAQTQPVTTFALTGGLLSGHRVWWVPAVSGEQVQ